MAKKKKDKEDIAKEVEQADIVEEMTESYLDYSMSVIVSRALPDVRDGLKPVQRRILYTMHEMHLGASSKTKKSSAVVGQVLGRYHPHGDRSVYNAMAHLAQDFSLRYPLLIGQGNWGCFTGDTKVRLTDGRDISFKEMAEERKQGKKHWGFTYNHNKNRIEVAELQNPGLTKKNEKLAQVELDNGEKIRCTLDHKFMLRDGSYKQAKNLESGDSLMPMYSKSYQGTENALDYLDDFSQIVEQAETYNHQVVKVEILEEREDVYDLTTKPHHNFLLSAGVFVHNSIDQDPPAASRYTEAKLSPVGEYLLKDIEMDTVDFDDNYDGTREEPRVLPAPLPQLLLNGTLGIAVGMATNFLPHNLTEVCEAAIHLLDNPDYTTEDLFEWIQGPDFPTGGVVYNQEQLVSSYSQGKGPVKVRGKARTTSKKRGAQIIIEEIPYRINKASLVKKIARLIKEDKLKGAKAVRDESDREGLRVVIDVSSSGYPKRILNRLYKYTKLQKTYHLNMVALVNGIQPKVLSLVDVLNHYLDHRKEVITRRTEFELEKRKKRAHILEGLDKALVHIDDIITLIKKSDDKKDARKKLMDEFDFTEKQAEAILNIRLHRLSKLEKAEVESELEEVEARIEELEEILSSEEKVKEVVKEELKQAKEEYGDERRTAVVESEIKKFNQKDLVPKRKTFVILTEGGYIKRTKPKAYRTQKRGGKGIIGMKTREKDIVKDFVSVSTHDQLLLFSNLGKVYRLPVYSIGQGSRVSRGKGVANYVPLSADEKILSLFTGETDKERKYLVMATKDGKIKKSSKKEYQNIRSSGIKAIKLSSGDLLVGVGETSGQDEILLGTQHGQSIRFSEEDVRATGRVTSGVKGIDLKKKDQVIGMHIVRHNVDSSEFTVLTLTEKGYGKRTDLEEYRVQNRGGKGVILAKTQKKTEDIKYFQLIKDEKKDLVVISQKGNIMRIKVKEISVLGRATLGVRVMKVKKGDKVAGALLFNKTPHS